MAILITNDDGIDAEGLRVLEKSVRGLDKVVVFAPDRERSSISHAISLSNPVRIKECGKDRYAVSGTPADCVTLAVKEILDDKPALVLSGINAGANLGDDVHYSGTVAGAREGAVFGISSIAVSMVGFPEFHYETVSKFLPDIIKKIQLNCSEPFFLNINFPNIPPEDIKGIEFTRQGRRFYNGKITRRKDPDGRDYFWLVCGEPSSVKENGTDFDAITNNKISITPLTLDTTNHTLKETLKSQCDF